MLLRKQEKMNVFSVDFFKCDWSFALGRHGRNKWWWIMIAFTTEEL